MSDLVVRLSDVVTRIATECKSLRTLTNGNAADLTALTTTTKTNLVAALNELASTITSLTATVNGKAAINDSATASATTWSSTKIQAQITAAINALVAGAPTALDTLAEIVTQLQSDESAASALTTAVGNRVRFDAAQTLTAGQKTQACANIGVGEPDTNFVTVFTTGLV